MPVEPALTPDTRMKAMNAASAETCAGGH